MNPIKQPAIRLLANLLLNPLTHFWLALLAGLFFYFLDRQRPARWLIGLSLAYLFLISTSPLPIWLAQQRERRYPVLHTIPDSIKKVNILVLGGGHSIAPTLPPNNQLSLVALGRLSEGVRLYRTDPDRACLIGSGYSSTGRTTQAEMLMQAAVVQGIPPADTLWSPTPYNTETEAYAYAARFGTETPLILVTSALHMPRAVYWFEQVGIMAIPAPTNHYVKPDPEKSPYNFKPSAVKVEIWGKLLHEWAGMAWARVK